MRYGGQTGVIAADEVVTVPMTFTATSRAISYPHARPVFWDLEACRSTMDVEQVERRITPRTGAILPVHRCGQPADLSPPVDLGVCHDILVIKDAAQALRGYYRGRRAGTVGLCGCFTVVEARCDITSKVR
jgi:dTDP-4-amino-4,6-dideoxygalactose transaminase